VTHFRSSSRPTGRLRAALALTGATLALVALAGCAPEGGSEPSASATTAPNASATAEPSAEPTASAEPTVEPTPVQPPEGTPVELACDQVITPDEAYELNPNLGTDPAYAPTSDTAVTATTYNGVSCGLLNQSSGEVIEISLAQPNEPLTNTLKDAALAGGDIVPTYGTAPEVEGYFSADTGTAQVFTGGYWVAVSSPDMIEPGDAERLMSLVLSNL